MNSSFIDRWGKWLLFAITALIYMRGLAGEFIWDDHTFFVENDILPKLKPWDLKEILLQPVSYWGENLPFSQLLFVLEFFSFGTFTPAYHVVSLLLYLGIGILAWNFVSNIYDEFPGLSVAPANDVQGRQLSILLVISLFLLHPVHVEAVAYISSQQHLLSVLFSLFSINIFWKAWRLNKLGKPGLLMVAITCYYLAVLAKYQAISTGLFIPLLWLILRHKGEGNPIKVLSVWGLVNIPLALWLSYSTSAYSGIGQTGLAFLSAVLRGVRILGAHLIIAFKPHPLNFGYPFDPAWSLDFNFLAGSLLLCALAIALVFYRRSIVSVGLLIFFIYFFPVMQVFVEVTNATIYDRYLLLPILGLCLVLERGFSILVLWQRGLKWLLGSLACLLVLILAILTFDYIPKFSSNLASLEHAYRTFPGWKRAAFDYESELIEAGYLDEAAIVNETEGTFSDPAWVRGYFAGRIALERGDIKQAIVLLKGSSRLIHQDGYFPFTGVPLGRALIQSGKLDEAELFLNDVLRSPINNPIERFRAKNLLAEIAAKKADQLRE